MTTDSRDVTSVLERVLSAYGFTMQKELSEKLGIASNNISSWLKRGSVPASVLVQCAMDTGSDVTWLVTGEFAKSNPSKRADEAPSLSGKALHEKILSSGGKPVLKRILDAYGFDTQKELADYLDIPTATISTWIRRDYFPGDVVIACALQTGTPLDFLAMGRTLINNCIQNTLSYIATIPKKELKKGNINSIGKVMVDFSFLPENTNGIIYIQYGMHGYLVDTKITELSNGIWLLDLNGKSDIYKVTLLPKGKINVAANDIDFRCEVGEVSVVGVVIFDFKEVR